MEIGQACGAMYSFESIRRIMEDPVAWQLLTGNEWYVRAVLKYARTVADN